MTNSHCNRARFGPFGVDLHTRELWKFGTRVKLVGQPFEILTVLLGRAGELVTRDELRSRLWPSDTFIDFNHGLNAAVNKLREALSDSAENPRYIETLPRRGYRFVATVEWLEPHAAPASLHDSSAAARIEPGPVFLPTFDPNTATQGAPTHSVWSRYFIGAGVLFTFLLGAALLIRTVLTLGEANAAHAVVVHTRPLLSISDTATPAFSPDGNSVAFFREHSQSGTAGIYVTPVGADHPQQLTGDEGDCCPVWSPDGHFIAFTRRAHNSYSIHVVVAGAGFGQMMRAEKALAEQSAPKAVRQVALDTAMKAAGFDHELSTGGVGVVRGELDWSPDGMFIAFAGGDGIYLLSPANAEVRRLTHTPPLSQDWGPAFAPDGDKILFVRDHQADLSNEILSISPGRGDTDHIYTEHGRIANSPQWSYDGRSVIFSSNRTGHPALWRLSLDSPAEATQVSEAGSPAWDPSVARRGYRLAFERLLRSLSIWQLDLSDSSHKTPYLLVSSTSDTDQGPGPQFSPDGQKLAYMSDRSGTMEIWIADRDGSNPFRLTAVGGAGTPRWSPDSRAVVFDVSQNGPKIISMNVHDGAPQTLAEGVCPSFSRDGKWVYFASNRTKGWQVWKVPTAGGLAIQVTQRGGHAALESFDGKFLYYAKNPMAEPEIWRVPTEAKNKDGREEAPVPLVRPGSWASWQVAEKGILFVGPSLGHQAVLSFYDFAKDRTTTVAVLNRTPFWLGATLDGKIVAFDQPGKEQAQAMLLENFR